MSRYRIRASNGMGASGGLSDYAIAEALRVALQYREQGFSNIILTDVDTGVEIELDRFIRENGARA